MSNDLSAETAQANIDQMVNSIRGQVAFNLAPTIIPEISRSSHDSPPSVPVPSTASSAKTPVSFKEDESDQRVRNLIMWIDEWGGLCDKLTEQQLHKVRAAIAQNSYERRMFKNPIATIVSFVLLGAMIGSLVTTAMRPSLLPPVLPSEASMEALERQMPGR